MDDYGNKTAATEISAITNNLPIGGYSDVSGDNVIPADKCAHQTDGSGSVIITYKIKDLDSDNCSVKDGSFYYQLNAGGWNAVSDAYVTGTKTELASAPTWGAEHTLTWASKQYIDNTTSSNVQIRFILNDGKSDSSYCTSEDFSVDNVYPTLTTDPAVAYTEAQTPPQRP